MSNEIYVKLMTDTGEAEKWIKYDANAIAKFERETKQSIWQIFGQLAAASKSDNDMAMMAALSIDNMRCLIWAGLLWRNLKRHLTVEQVGSMMPLRQKDLIANMLNVMTALSEALGADEEEAAELEEAIQGNPTSESSAEGAEKPLVQNE